MIRYYITRIQNEVINEKTGEKWKLEDVPPFWKEKVAAQLEE